MRWFLPTFLRDSSYKHPVFISIICDTNLIVIFKELNVKERGNRLDAIEFKSSELTASCWNYN